MDSDLITNYNVHSPTITFVSHHCSMYCYCRHQACIQWCHCQCCSVWKLGRCLARLLHSIDSVTLTKKSVTYKKKRSLLTNEISFCFFPTFSLWISVGYLLIFSCIFIWPMVMLHFCWHHKVRERTVQLYCWLIISIFNDCWGGHLFGLDTFWRVSHTGCVVVSSLHCQALCFPTDKKNIKQKQEKQKIRYDATEIKRRLQEFVYICFKKKKVASKEIKMTSPNTEDDCTDLDSSWYLSAKTNKAEFGLQAG